MPVALVKTCEFNALLQAGNKPPKLTSTLGAEGNPSPPNWLQSGRFTVKTAQPPGKFVLLIDHAEPEGAVSSTVLCGRFTVTV